MPESDSSLLETFYGTTLIPREDTLRPDSRSIASRASTPAVKDSDRQFQRKRRHKTLEVDKFGEKRPRKQKASSTAAKLQNILVPTKHDSASKTRRISVDHC